MIWGFAVVLSSFAKFFFEIDVDGFVLQGFCIDDDEFLAVEPVAFEEVLARGMLICRLPYEKLLEQFGSQVVCIDDWCACDTFCSGAVKLIKKHRTEFFEEVVDKLLTDDAPEFAVLSMV